MKNKLKTGNLGFLLVVLLIITIVEVYETKSFIKPVISITGSVTDLQNGSAIDTKINVYDKDNKIKYRTKTYKASDGKFFVTGLVPGENYTIEIDAKDYHNLKQNIELPASDKYLEIEQNFELNKVTY